MKVIPHRRMLAAVLCVAISGCAAPPAVNRPSITLPAPQPAGLQQVTLSNVPGWPGPAPDEIVRQLARQCAIVRKKPATPMSDAVCSMAALQGSAPPMAAEPAKRWIERYFTAYEVLPGDERSLFTGYYEPELRGSLQADQIYRTPLYGAPPDLLTVQLATLYPALKNQRVRGRLDGNKVVPYFSRADMARGQTGQAQALVWIDDPLDAFLLEVQGSGRVTLPDGQSWRLGYADQNGHPYVAIGKKLVEWGELPASEATIPGIRSWARAHPGRVRELLDQNPSVVFFRKTPLTDPMVGPNGSLGVPLTPERSLAVDPSVVPLGSMVFLDTTRPDGAPFQRLLLAQDTGGAIKGRVRGDIFWGWGSQAGELAGVTRQSGRLWLIWPKGLAPPQAAPVTASE
ncbi:MAG: murein transglycosylase A [Burkholderiaceae bacterium]